MRGHTISSSRDGPSVYSLPRACQDPNIPCVPSKFAISDCWMFNEVSSPNEALTGEGINKHI